MSDSKPRIGLFVTCLVDLLRPSVGFAAVELLEASGCVVEVPQSQTCCGQPAYNSGDRKDAQAVARATIEAMEGFDYVVAPSGSCAAMLREHYPTLFKDGDVWRERARHLAERTHELISFLVDVRGLQGVSARLSAHATYHDSCSGLRELGVKDQPRKLLNSVEGLQLTELRESEVCCGFGGTFCVKYPDISNEMVTSKVRDIEASGAKLLLAGDLGCLLNMAGKLKRLGSQVEVRHVAEVLAGHIEQPAIGEERN
ncbi:(Fe-S)-binding protein [Limibacillus halophilus]|uniref:L-lactate dehydrogenase complex protein LldE n=1 Tax=Limibacillus halophilus TaxID=1579333 RepID=A0A839SPC2_9PROT|nr:(Fe-S)-binding protein [Limibacillus halophilus]MBB3064048.1 L-lactate dehydrogenase complex protein LldE [Limibacillus halophilus]